MPANDEQQAERRKNGGLSEEQVTAIKDAILASVYEDIGRSLVKKAIWAVGAVFLVLLGWLGAKGYLPQK